MTVCKVNPSCHRSKSLHQYCIFYGQRPDIRNYLLGSIQSILTFSDAYTYMSECDFSILIFDSRVVVRYISTSAKRTNILYCFQTQLEIEIHIVIQIYDEILGTNRTFNYRTNIENGILSRYVITLKLGSREMSQFIFSAFYL